MAHFFTRLLDAVSIALLFVVAEVAVREFLRSHHHHEARRRHRNH
jgi:hypothetical protein